MKEIYFKYGEKEISYLKSKDKLLGEAIDKIGYIERPVQSDLFSSLVNSIIGQQISTTAHLTVWSRVCDLLGEVTADTICEIDSEKLQKCGLTFRKVNYIKDLAKKVQNGEFNIEALWEKSDEDVIAELTSLKGIGVWTAEMLMIFCMQRQNILSFGDLAIHRGMRMLYHHRNIDRQLFLKYRRRYSPYCTVASLYIWKVAGGAIEGMKDYAPKKKR